MPAFRHTRRTGVWGQKQSEAAQWSRRPEWLSPHGTAAAGAWVSLGPAPPPSSHRGFATQDGASGVRPGTGLPRVFQLDGAACAERCSTCLRSERAGTVR